MSKEVIDSLSRKFVRLMVASSWAPLPAALRHDPELLLREVHLGRYMLERGTQHAEQG